MKNLNLLNIFATRLAKNCHHLSKNPFLLLRKVLFLFLPVFLISCSDKKSESPEAVAQVAPIGGILMPESAYTMRDGRIFVSEIGEFGKDGDGKIVEISLDGTKKIIADTGLNDPKGIMVEADTIFVTDNNEVKKVSLSGEVETWLKPDDFPRKPQFLNDITIDKNTIIYISDSGDLLNGNGGGAIFRVDSNKKVSVLVDKENDERIRSPNGLSTFQRGYLAFNDFENGGLFRVRLRDMEVEKISEGFGGADGLVYSGIYLYLSDWKNGKIWKLDVSKVGSDPIMIKDGMQGSADIDVTPDGKYLVIPEMKANQVVFHPLN